MGFRKLFLPRPFPAGHLLPEQDKPSSFRNFGYRLLDTGLELIAEELHRLRRSYNPSLGPSYGVATYDITASLNTTRIHDFEGILADVARKLHDCQEAHIYIRTNGHVEKYVSVVRDPNTSNFEREQDPPILPSRFSSEQRISNYTSADGVFLDHRKGNLMTFNLAPGDFTFVNKSVPVSYLPQKIAIPLVFDGKMTGLLVFTGNDLSLSNGPLLRKSEAMKLTLTYLVGTSRMLSMIYEETLDAGTKLKPKGVFIRGLEGAVNNYFTKGEGFTLLMMDIDHFKRVNDEISHLAGDAVLRDFARILSGLVRTGNRGGKKDLLCRYGGEEFAAILYGCKLDDAVRIVGRIRRTLDEKLNTLDNGQKLTASCGIVDAGTAFANSSLRALYPDASSHILGIADKGLYHVKHQGRNNLAVARLADGSIDYDLAFERSNL
ncbi:GGDEF domain-containing protein [Candidatus Micrarchaeota archaeon]|nr:GGDEF domain-containing protein [Candidatus Micrarchaeota archaeon]